MESLICSFYLSVAARKIVCADPSPEIHSHVAGTLSNQPTTNIHCQPDRSGREGEGWRRGGGGGVIEKWMEETKRGIYCFDFSFFCGLVFCS